jgi:HKD family nuclease
MIGDAEVIGLPTGFDILAELEHSSSILIATAYAQLSGWNRLEKVILDSKVRASLLCGLDHNFTQPQLLNRWMRLGTDGQIDARVFLSRGRPLFHPKILIVNSASGKKEFAIVGSGNLSEGGVLRNIECSMYTDEKDDLSRLRVWFQEIFSRGRPITPDLIQCYEPIYRKARFDLKKAQKASVKLENALAAFRKSSNSRQLEKVRRADLSFHVVNTNIKNDMEDHHHMLDKHEACAFNTPWKYEIQKIKRRDLVFLYQSYGSGIIAFGQATGKLEKRDHCGDKLDAYCAPLIEFRKLMPTITPTEIRGLDNSGKVLRRAVEHIPRALGHKLYKMALQRSF